MQTSKPLDLSGRTLFVTGATGFLGKSLLDYLNESAVAYTERTFRVWVMSRTPDKFLNSWAKYRAFKWLKFVEGDLENFPPTNGEITDVIHAGGETHDVADKRNWLRATVDGTETCLRWAESVGARRFLFVSSGAIYGPQPREIASIPEDFSVALPTIHASSVYGQAKRMSEQLCTVYGGAAKMEVVIARVFAVISEYVPLNGPYAVGNFLRDALHNNAIRVGGDGSAVRTYIYGRDLAHWILTLLSFGLPGEAYNVGSDFAVTIADLAALIASVASPNKRVLIENVMGGEGSRSVYVPNISKAKSLGLRIETSLKQAINITISNLRSN